MYHCTARTVAVSDQRKGRMSCPLRFVVCVKGFNVSPVVDAGRRGLWGSVQQNDWMSGSLGLSSLMNQNQNSVYSPCLLHKHRIYCVNTQIHILDYCRVGEHVPFELLKVIR